MVLILCQNNSATIRKTLESVLAFGPILVGDLGSSDNTLDICEEFGAQIKHIRCDTRDQARNKLCEDAQGPCLWIEPWEIVISASGKSLEGTAYATVLQNKTITKEIRIWDGSPRFINPIFERLDLETDQEKDIVIYSNGGALPANVMESIEIWKAQEPLATAPYYYQSAVLFSTGKMDDFLRVAEHYLFMEKSVSMSAIMMRYYFSIAQVIHRKTARPALQNLNLCLCAKPLMAEFWCLTGDVYYHLMQNFDLAREFYENAILMGRKRLKADLWPMEIVKYNTYPKKLIESCDQILSTTARLA